MRISVIIPVYNGGQYIEKAINSILSQPYSSKRIIIVDDGSTDDTPEICDTLAKKYSEIHVIHKVNGGVSNARNTAIDYIMKTAEEKEFIGFCDADDEWSSDVITQEMIENNSDADMLIFATVYEQINGRISEIRGGGNSTVTECYKHLWDFRGTFASMLYSTELMKKFDIHFDPKLKYAEDNIFRWECIYYSDKIVSFSDILYHYITDIPGSAMKKTTTYSAKDLYLPLIDGWIRFDDFVNLREPEIQYHCNIGYDKAAFYMLDMLQRAFSDSIKDKEHIIYLVKNHPHYKYFLNMNWDKKAKSLIQLLSTHPFLFRARCFTEAKINFTKEYAKAILHKFIH